MSPSEDKLLKSAEWYAASLGWKILPVHGITEGLRCTCRGDHKEPKDIGKHPASSRGQNDATSDVETIKRWWHTEPYYNIGVNCKASGFFVIDIDPRSGGADSFDKFEKTLKEPLPKTLEATTGTYNIGSTPIRGRHLYFRCDASEDLIMNMSAAGLPGIDIKHNGYVLITPSNHYSGTTYEWVDGHRPDQIEIADAPEELLELLRKKNRKKGTSLGTTDWTSAFSGLEYAGSAIDIDKLMADGLVEGERAVKIYQIACALANKYPVDTEHGALAVETLMIRFNAEKVRPPMELEGPNSVLMHTRRAIQFVKDNPKSNLFWPAGTSFEPFTEFAKQSQKETTEKLQSERMSKESSEYSHGGSDQEITMIGESIRAGNSMRESLSNRTLNIAPDQDAIYEEDGGTPGKRSLTDTGNGRRLVDNFHPVMRYTEGLGWFFWDGSHWKPDVEKLDMREITKKLGAIIAAETKQYSDEEKIIKVAKWANDSKAVARMNSAMEAANSDSRIRLNVDDWDKSPDLLGVKNGVVDLRTGELIKNSPDLYITRSCPVGYIPHQSNKRWEMFLDFATGGDKEFQNWLQRAAGYSITGRNTQDIMFLVYGPAGSGKNTFVEALVKALGTKQYAWPFDTSVLAAGDGKSNSNQDQYHWAELRGRRIVWLDELPDSERIKENSIKRLTGSSEIPARSPGGKPFNFESQAKLWISTNHRPIITDDAMWRRIRPIPFLNVPEKSDPDLKDYIFSASGGLPAVLAWAVEGAIEVLNSSKKDPLGWCKVVQDAADIYRKNEDRIGLFLEEETKENPDAVTPVKDIYSQYRIWCEQRGERPLQRLGFDRKLHDRNIKIEGSGAKATIAGIMLPPRLIHTETIVDLGMYAERYKI